MQAPPRTTNRFEALDGWRGVCACLVVLFHFHGYSPLYTNALVRHSYLFVDFFFVLSGFVIAWNYQTRLDDWQGVRRFLILRLGRVYPLHLFMLLCFVAFETLRALAHSDGVFTGPNSPSAVISNLFLLQSMGVHDSLTWNGPAWSISTEMWTYVAFALVCAWLGMRNWMLLATALVAPLALAALSKSGMDTTFDWGFIRCIFGFALGVACCRIYALVAPYAHSPGRATMTMVEVAIVFAVVAFVAAAGTSPMSFMAPFVFAAAVLIFAAEGGLVSRIFHSRPLKWLGTVSYSIYLTHFFFVLILPMVVKRVTHLDLWTAMPLPDGQWTMAYGRNGLEGTFFYLLVVAMTLAGSALTYRYVEVPGREWTRRWLARPQVSTQVQAANP
ncbi:acyltransferase family protein [Ramlibacter sp. PS4R-6]|uniref:acyltransferase family protein n=1 Tax=Ramlibacter sp. PS4R-6 TaxID=3133438 RepID=UPI0030AB8C77